jgi:hypothetical protein
MLLSGAHCANVMPRFPHWRHIMARQKTPENKGFEREALLALKLGDKAYLNH